MGNLLYAPGKKIKLFFILFCVLSVSLFAPARSVQKYRTMLPTPRTDQLVYPNGCLATSILEHARIPERETIQYEAELKRLIELSLELVWELQHLCKKPIHLKQEKELLALQEAK